jgi:hypothetical protein
VVEARFFEHFTDGIEMDRFNESKFYSFVGQQSVTPLSVPFWWCGAGKSGDFGSSDSIKFGGSSGALLVMDDICAEGLRATQARQVLP